MLKSHGFQSVNTVAKENVLGQITNDSPTRISEMSSINTSSFMVLKTNTDAKWKSIELILYLEILVFIKLFKLRKVMDTIVLFLALK